MPSLDSKIINGLSETSKKILYGGDEDSKPKTPEELGCPPCPKPGIFSQIINAILLFTIVVLILYAFNLYKQLQEIDNELLQQEESEPFFDISKTKEMVSSSIDNINTTYNKYTDKLKYTYNENIKPIINNTTDITTVVNTEDNGNKPYESEARIDLKPNSLYEPKVKGFTTDMDIVEQNEVVAN